MDLEAVLHQSETYFVFISKSSFNLIPGGFKKVSEHLRSGSLIPAAVTFSIFSLHSLSPRLSPGGASLCSPAWRGFKWVTFETIRGAPARTNAEWRAATPGSWFRRLLELPVDYIDPLKQWGPATLIVVGELINNNMWITAGFVKSRGFNTVRFGGPECEIIC